MSRCKTCNKKTKPVFFHNYKYVSEYVLDKKDFDLSDSEMKSWDNIHRMAASAVTCKLKKEFKYYIKYLRDNFPCKECRYHIDEYLNKHPMEDYYDIYDSSGNDIGIAEWSWRFHNEVNERLNKPFFSWSDFIETYIY